jgi:putative hemolysin
MISWLLLMLSAVLVQGFFALFEMASVSIHKIRLQYAAASGERWARWLQYLLQRPARLFGTTLLGINAALQVGSECARRFYESVGLDPDWAPLSQVLLVIVFGELVPLFTARRHPDPIAKTFAPLMAILAYVLTPVIWVFDQLPRLVRRKRAVVNPLSREEIRMAFEEKPDEFTRAANAIFQLKNQTAGQLMVPLSQAVLFPTNATVRDAREKLRARYVPMLPLYQKSPEHIIGMVAVRDLLPLGDNQPLIEKAKSPWFVTKTTSALQLLEQFRRNNQTAAVILEPSGQACGLLTLDQIVDTLLGPESVEEIDEEPVHFISRTLDGSMLVDEFNAQFEADLPGTGTLEELILSKLDHAPVREETVQVGGYEFTVLEPTVRGIKTLSVRTLQE